MTDFLFYFFNGELESRTPFIKSLLRASVPLPQPSQYIGIWYECRLEVLACESLDYALCSSGAVNTQGFVWTLFYAPYNFFHLFISFVSGSTEFEIRTPQLVSQSTLPFSFVLKT